MNCDRRSKGAKALRACVGLASFQVVLGAHAVSQDVSVTAGETYQPQNGPYEQLSVTGVGTAATVTGHAWHEPSPAPNAWAHFDAYSLTNLSDGANVKTWSGGSVTATSSGDYNPTFKRNFFAGKPAIWFNYRSMSISEERNDVRELFVAYADYGWNNKIQWVGGSTAAQFPHDSDTTAPRLFIANSHVTTAELNAYQVRHDGLVVATPGGYVTAEDYGFHVISVACPTDRQVGYLGESPNGVGKSGSGYLAEVIVYTNVLTQAQRDETYAYLEAKWRNPKAADVWRLRFAADADSAVGVPAGTTLAVEKVELAEGKTALTKEGGGTLALDRANVAQPSVTVRGGAVAVKALADVTDDEPAGDPWVWLDANVNCTEDANHPGHVENWKDCRKGKTASAVPSRTAYNMKGGDSGKVTLDRGPRRIQLDNGLYILDFGNYSASFTDAEEAKANCHSMYVADLENKTQPLGDSFIVYRNKDNTYPNTPFFYDRANTGDDLFAYWNTGDALRNAWWRQNGVDLLDWQKRGPVTTEELNVYSFFPVALTQWTTLFSRFCSERQYYAGGGQIAEIIVYRRRLTPEERVQTEAYLMKKWLPEGRQKHPYAQQVSGFASLKYETDATPMLETDRALSVGTLSVVSGQSFAVEGAGSVSVGKVGSLSAWEEEMFADAFLRFDASDESSFDKTWDEANQKWNVNVWNDVRGASYGKATATYDYAAPWEPSRKVDCTTLPVFRKTAINGVEKNTVDFGMMSVVENGVCSGGAMMLFSKKPAQMRVGFVVQADLSYRNNDAPPIFGNGGTFVRQDKAPFCWYGSGWNASFLSGEGAYVGIDENGGCGHTSVPKDTFKVFTVDAADDASGAQDCYGLSIERTYSRGGNAVCEVIMFDKEIGETRRNAIRDYLMKKWLGTKGAYPQPTLAGVSAGAGVTVGELGVAQNGVLSFTWNGESFGVLAVTDSFEPAGTLTVKPSGNPKGKEWLLATFPAGTVLSLSQFVLDATGLYGVAEGRRQYQLRVEDNRLYLDKVPKGLCVIIK